MRKRPVPPEPSKPATFGDYLAELVAESSHQTSTAVARAAGVQPSTVRRWIAGETRPDLAALQAVAPVLGVSVQHLIEAAYPEQGHQVPQTFRIKAHTALAHAGGHHLAREVDELLDTLPVADRRSLETVLDAVLDRYRRHQAGDDRSA